MLLRVEGRVGVCCLYCDLLQCTYLIIHSTDDLCGSPEITMHHFVFLFFVFFCMI